MGEQTYVEGRMFATLDQIEAAVAGPVIGLYELYRKKDKRSGKTVVTYSTQSLASVPKFGGKYSYIIQAPVERGCWITCFRATKGNKLSADKVAVHAICYLPVKPDDVDDTVLAPAKVTGGLDIDGDRFISLQYPGPIYLGVSHGTQLTARYYDVTYGDRVG